MHSGTDFQIPRDNMLQYIIIRYALAYNTNLLTHDAQKFSGNAPINPDILHWYQ